MEEPATTVALLDVAVAIVLLLSGILAYFRGLAREVLSLATWVGAGFAAYFGYAYARPYVQTVIETRWIADITTGAGLFLIALVLLTLVNHSLSSRVKESFLGALDRALGFLFGVARGALLVCVAYIVSTWFFTEKDLPDFVTEARATPVMKTGADVIISYLPERMRTQIKEAADEAKSKAEEAKKTEQLFQQLTQPKTKKSDEAKKPPSAYSDTERKGLEKLIEKNQ